ncbi:MAG: DUF2185 domain-containing protein [Asticcacaulis sp.]|uniref:immunity protein Imm33 domain-containing protein n=1 Tax=Asticcacaulis sp. TaxID=1872648 RepID=UPI0039E61EDC
MLKWLPKPIYNLWRRYFGTYTLDDPRPIAKEAPYTFFIPASFELQQIQAGDLVKLMFRSHPRGKEWDMERMWVEVTAVTSSTLQGRLANTPFDMPQIKEGDSVHFERSHVISWRTERDVERSPEYREYWDRCMVDTCVTKESVPVYYIYREEPDMAQDGDKYPDSGWRIRGDYRNVSDEELEARKQQYIALGKVLNADDSWIHLIDSPIGSAFMKNFETGVYEPYDRVPSDD